MDSQLTVDLTELNTAALLEDWSWLLNRPHEVVMVTAMGDAFIADSDGAVSFLDTLAATITRVASSRASFDRLLESGEYDPDWFNPDMVALMASEPLEPGQCYRYKESPILGGSFASSNVEPADALVHFSIMGQLHRQVRDLPSGARITGFRVVGANDEPVPKRSTIAKVFRRLFKRPRSESAV